MKVLHFPLVTQDTVVLMPLTQAVCATMGCTSQVPLSSHPFFREACLCRDETPPVFFSLFL